MWLMEGGILTAAVRYRWVRFPVPHQAAHWESRATRDNMTDNAGQRPRPSAKWSTQGHKGLRL